MILELERRVDNLRKETRALKRDAKQLSRQFEQAILQNQMFQHSMQNTPKRMVATGIPFDYRGPAVSQNCWASTGFSASSAMSSAGDVLTCFPTKLEIAIAECGTVNGVLDISLRLSLLKCLRDERLATAARIRRAELDGTHQEG